MQTNVIQIEGTTHFSSGAGVLPPPARDDAALVNNYLLAKQFEREAIGARREAQAALAARIGVDANGATTKTEVAGYICSARMNMASSVSAEGAEMLRGELPGPLFDRLIRFKPEINARELNYIKNNEPGIYSVIAARISAKPGSVNIDVRD